MPRKRQAAGLGNRTDLISGPVAGGAPPTPSQLQPPNQTQAQPIQVATGQAYGQAQAQRQAQQALPLPQAQQSYEQSPIEAAARGMTFAPVPLGAPSQRPDEPVTSGIPTGPGSNTPPVGGPANPRLADTLALLAQVEPGLTPFANLARYQEA